MEATKPIKPERVASGRLVKGPSQGQPRSAAESRENSLDSVAERRELVVVLDRINVETAAAAAAPVLELPGGVQQTAEVGGGGRKRSLVSCLVSGLTDSDDTEVEISAAAKVSTSRRGRPVKAGHKHGDFVRPRSVASDEELGDILRSRKLKKGASAASVADAVLDPGSESDVLTVVGDMSGLNAQELRAQAGGMLACILEVARKSGNLKGEFVARLKRSASTLREVVDTLASRSEAEETRCLRATNSRLKMEMEALQVEVKGLRKAYSDALAKVAAANNAATTSGGSRPLPVSMADAIEELRGSLTATLGQMVSARIEALEDRLLPAPTVRPALRADTRKKAAATQPKPSSASTAAPEVVPVAGPSGTQKPSRAAPPTVAQGESWTAVVKKGKGKGKGKSSLPQATPATGASAPTARPKAVLAAKPKAALTAKPKAAQAAKSKAAPKTVLKKKVALRAPGSAAVVLAMQPEAAQQGVTYSAILMKAQAAVDLRELGIDQLRYRQTATGARMLEIPGSQNSEKADRLAEKLRTVLSAEASVVRPVKSTDLSVTGLDDATTEEGLAKVVAETGRCDVRLVKVGRIRRGSGNGGAGSTIVSCPVSAAKVLLNSGRILVGWSSVRVTAMGDRPMRCYRCMGLGHTRPQCTATADRGDLCFWCGGAGHKAATCSRAEPRCAICAESGRPYGHKMGGRSCVPPKMRGQTPGSSGIVSAVAVAAAACQRGSASEMELVSD